MATYGSVVGVASYVRHVALDTPNAPATTDVQTWLDARAAQLTAWLAEAGYSTPVTLPAAKAVLDRYANIGAAGDVELAQWSAGHNADDENRRESKFLAEFAKAEAWVKSQALASLGVEQVAAVVRPSARQAASGAITAGSASDTTRTLPPDWR